MIVLVIEECQTRVLCLCFDCLIFVLRLGINIVVQLFTMSLSWSCGRNLTIKYLWIVQLNPKQPCKPDFIINSEFHT